MIEFNNKLIEEKAGKKLDKDDVEKARIAAQQGIKAEEDAAMELKAKAEVRRVADIAKRDLESASSKSASSGVNNPMSPAEITRRHDKHLATIPEGSHSSVKGSGKPPLRVRPSSLTPAPAGPPVKAGAGRPPFRGLPTQPIPLPDIELIPDLWLSMLYTYIFSSRVLVGVRESREWHTRYSNY